jgi:hypothetical protein
VWLTPTTRRSDQSSRMLWMGPACASPGAHSTLTSQEGAEVCGLPIVRERDRRPSVAWLSEAATGVHERKRDEPVYVATPTSRRDGKHSAARRVPLVLVEHGKKAIPSDKRLRAARVAQPDDVPRRTGQERWRWRKSWRMLRHHGQLLPHRV